MKLPEGFVLEETSQELPQGFILEEEAPKEPFTMQPLTEEQKAFSEAEAQRIAPDQSVIPEFGKQIGRAGLDIVFGDVGAEQAEAFIRSPLDSKQREKITEDLIKKGTYEEVRRAERQALRAGAKTLVDSATLGVGGGYVDDIEASIRMLRGEDFNEVKDEIKKEYEMMPTSAKFIEGTARLGSSLAGGGLVGKTALGSKAIGLGASALGRAGLGGASAYGESDGDLVSTGLGAGIGLVSPALSKPLAKGADVLAKTSGKARNFVNKITSTIKPQTINKIAPQSEARNVLVSGIKSSKKMAQALAPRVDDSIRQTNTRVNKAILKDFGVSKPEDLMKQSKTEFADWNNWAKDKSIPMNKVKNLLKSDIVSKEVKKIKANNPQKWGDVADNNISFLQEVKSKVGAKARKGGVDSADFEDARGLISDFIDNNSTGFKEMNQKYAMSKGKEKLAQTMMKGKARMGSNVASLLDKPDTYTDVADQFGEDVARRLEKTIVNQKDMSEGLKVIQTAIKGKLSKQMSDVLRSPKGLGELGLSAYAVSNPAVGLGGLGVVKGADMYSAGKASNLLTGSREFDPFVAAILAGKMGTAGDSPFAKNPFLYGIGQLTKGKEE